MHENPHLDSIIARESYAELLAELTPKQLSIAALRADGIPVTLAAQLLGISTQTLHERIRTAQGHLLHNCPHIRSRMVDS